MNPKYEMISRYLDELTDIGGLPRKTEEEKQEYFSVMMREPNMDWKDIRVDGKIIGFLVTGTPPNCHPDADYYLEETYIIPEYRKQGYMSSAASEFLETHPGTYCLLIMDRNGYAIRFWQHRFTEAGYVPCPLSDVGAADGTCTQYGFRPGKN